MCWNNATWKNYLWVACSTYEWWTQEMFSNGFIWLFLRWPSSNSILNLVFLETKQDCVALISYGENSTAMAVFVVIGSARLISFILIFSTMKWVYAGPFHDGAACHIARELQVPSPSSFIHFFACSKARRCSWKIWPFNSPFCMNSKWINFSLNLK